MPGCSLDACKDTLRLTGHCPGASRKQRSSAGVNLEKFSKTAGGGGGQGETRREVDRAACRSSKAHVRRHEPGEWRDQQKVLALKAGRQSC